MKSKSYFLPGVDQRTSGDWARLIDALPGVQMRAQVASVVWWEFQTVTPGLTVALAPATVHYDFDARLDWAMVERVLVSMGYLPRYAAQKARRGMIAEQATTRINANRRGVTMMRLLLTAEKSLHREHWMN